MTGLRLTALVTLLLLAACKTSFAPPGSVTASAKAGGTVTRASTHPASAAPGGRAPDNGVAGAQSFFQNTCTPTDLPPAAVGADQHVAHVVGYDNAPHTLTGGPLSPTGVLVSLAAPPGGLSLKVVGADVQYAWQSDGAAFQSSVAHLTITPATLPAAVGIYDGFPVALTVPLPTTMLKVASLDPTRKPTQRSVTITFVADDGSTVQDVQHQPLKLVLALDESGLPTKLQPPVAPACKGPDPSPQPVVPVTGGAVAAFLDYAPALGLERKTDGTLAASGLTLHLAAPAGSTGVTISKVSVAYGYSAPTLHPDDLPAVSTTTEIDAVAKLVPPESVKAFGPAEAIAVKLDLATLAQIPRDVGLVSAFIHFLDEKGQTVQDPHGKPLSVTVPIAVD